MRHARTLPAMCLAVLAAGAAAAEATEVVLGAPGSPAWQLLEFPKIARHTTYAAVRADGIDAIEGHAVCSASALYIATDAVDLRRTPRLRWQWKIAHGINVADERQKAGDDFAARVSIMFRFDASHASFWENVRHRVGAALYSTMVPGNTLNYVWSSRLPAGTTWDNPYDKGTKMISLGRGALPRWTEALVDVATDYTALFGAAPPPAVAVAVMTDTDDTCQDATTYYADFRFLSRY